MYNNLLFFPPADYNSQNFWTSGNNIGPDGKKFVWDGIADGQRAHIDPSWWWQGQPDNYDHKGVREHCIELKYEDKTPHGLGRGFKLNDNICSEKNL